MSRGVYIFHYTYGLEYTLAGRPQGSRRLEAEERSLVVEPAPKGRHGCGRTQRCSLVSQPRAPKSHSDSQTCNTVSTALVAPRLHAALCALCMLPPSRPEVAVLST